MDTKKLDLVETLHGTAVADPYRWLEDSDSPEVHAWTGAQNAHTNEVLGAFAGRDALERQIEELLEIGYVGAPAVRGKRYLHTRREGRQSQPTIYVRDGHDGEDRVLLDASTLSSDGTTAVDWWYPSRDGGLVAWGRSESGSEESTLHLRDVATGKDLADQIPHTRHASVAFAPDGKSFYYSRYPANERYDSKIFHHVIGTDPADDPLVFETRDKTDIPSVGLSPDGHWLVVRVHMGWDKSEIWIKDRRSDGPWIPVAIGRHAIFEPLPRNDRLYLHTNEDAPRYRLCAVDYTKPTEMSTLIPEGPDVLDSVTILQSEIVGEYMHDASSRLERFGLDGQSKGSIELPGIGSASVTGPWDSDELFVTFTSYVVPYQVFRRPPGAGGELEPWARVRKTFDAGEVEVERLYARSKDGTRVPMFVIAKKGLPRDGRAPAVLYGYGGFNVNLTPAFSARALASVNRGMVWVTAVLRGGGELGEAWHQGGMRDRKQNTFDDFAACAETLIHEKITSADRLAAMGGSNGGLLVAASVTQRPDLFRAGLSLVPLTDMIRYHQFRIAKLWIPEYGDPDKAEDFPFLYAYSPYHHVEAGTRYPAMLFTTAESDSRVDPMHARKMAARMQEMQPGRERPILLRVETKAGHGAGKPIAKVRDEMTDELTFLFQQLGVEKD